MLEEGKDALAAGRVGRDREDDAGRERPGREGAAVGAPPLKDRFRVVGDRRPVEGGRSHK